MGMADRVLRRLAKEEAEKQRRQDAVPDDDREKSYEELDKYLAEYDRLLEEHPYTICEEARLLWNNLIVSEHGHDLVEVYRQFRSQKKK
jgi:hypothetical protein